MQKVEELNLEKLQNARRLIIHKNKNNHKIATMGICGFRNITKMKKAFYKTQKNGLLEKCKIEKINQITLLSKNFGRLYGIIIIKGENIPEYLIGLGLPYFFTDLNFEKNLDRRDFVFLKEQVLFAE